MSGVSESDLVEVAQLLKIPAQKRAQRDVQRIAKLTKGVKFFADYDSSVHEDCCRYMKHAEYPAGVYIFKKGAPGDSFCIILKGRVGVLVPPAKPALPSAPQAAQRLHPPVRVKARLAAVTRSLFAVTMLTHVSVAAKEPLQVAEESQEESEPMEVAELGAGASFGELSLLQDLPRSASIFCKESTVLAVLSKNSFNLVLKEYEARKLNEKIAFLRSIPAFESWSRQALSKLTYYLKERKFKRAQTVFQEGEPSTDVFFVLQGEFKLTKTCHLLKSAQDRFGQRTSSTPAELQLVIKGPGEMFGEQEVLGDQSRGYNCTCVSTTGRLWVIAKFDFLRRLSSSETWNFIYKRDEVQRKWMHERLEHLLDIEMMKLKPQEEQKKDASQLDSEASQLATSLKRFSNTVLDCGGQRERSGEWRSLRSSPRCLGSGRSEKRGFSSVRGFHKVHSFLRRPRHD